MSAEHIKLDFDRAARIGFGEAIFCAGKSIAQLTTILDQASDRQASFLLTRLDASVLRELPARSRESIDYDPLSRTGFFGKPPPLRADAKIAIVAAGTSDVAVAREAARTLEFNAEPSAAFNDIGVAGLWRLMERIDAIKRFPVVVAVAGMDAALVSVLGGLVGAVLIAVPTSTGYGVAHGGETALFAALTSCAPGVTVVNIDNGYGAACAALRVLRSVRKA